MWMARDISRLLFLPRTLRRGLLPTHRQVIPFPDDAYARLFSFASDLGITPDTDDVKKENWKREIAADVGQSGDRVNFLRPQAIIFSRIECFAHATFNFLAR